MTAWSGTTVEALLGSHWQIETFIGELRRALAAGRPEHAALIAYAITLSAAELLCAADNLAAECAGHLSEGALAVRLARSGSGSPLLD